MKSGPGMINAKFLSFCLLSLMLTACDHLWHSQKNNDDFSQSFSAVEFNDFVYEIQSGYGSSNKTDSSLQLTLRVSRRDASDILKYEVNSENEFQKNVYYYCYLFEHDVRLKFRDKEFEPVLFHFEKLPGKKNQRIFHFRFSVPPDLEQAELIIDSDRLSVFPLRIKIPSN